MHTGSACDGLAPQVLRGAGNSWPKIVSSMFVESEFERLGRPNSFLRGRVDRQPFGDLTFLHTRTQGDGHRVIRSNRLIRSSRHNNFFIGCLLSGSAELSQNGRTAQLRPGDIAILDSTREYSIEVPRGFEALWIHAPRYWLEGRLQDVPGVLATKIDGTAGVGHLASQMARTALAEAARLTPRQVNRVANSLLELLGLALQREDHDTDPPPSSHCAAMLRRVHAYIEVRLCDDALTPAGIARANGISVRYLNKLFSQEGDSVARWIRIRRLERCRAELEDPAAASRHIAEIAYAHGFKNVPHFNRLFRSRFGCPPGALRPGCRSGVG